MAVVAALGLAIGLLLGLLGAGGSILAVPALVYGAGLPLAVAVPTGLLVVGVTAAAAAVPRARRGQVSWRVAAVVGSAGIPATLVGAEVNRALDPRVVLGGFALVMLAAGVRMLRRDVPSGGACALPGGRVDWRGCLPKALGAGAAVGLLTGIFGVGGGFLLVPALVLLLGLPMEIAVGTSLVVIALNSGVGFAAHAGHADLDWALVTAFTAAAVTGSVVASRIAGRLPVARLRRWFAVLVLGVGGAVLVSVSIG